jgi:predicted nucleic acid-binding protein
MSEKVFVDTDVVIDLLTKRHPFYEAASKLFSLAADRKIDLFISPIIVSNLHYILRKAIGQAEAINAIIKLRVLTKIVTIDEEIVDLVLSSKYKDIEDGFQYYGAIKEKIKILVTRNVKDYIGKELSIMNAEEYLGYYKQKKELKR